MKGPDLDRERSEKELTLREFLVQYNQGLPEGYPEATAPLLKKFCEAYPSAFKDSKVWSLGHHRKRVMDWLPAYLRANPEA
jgi:hypothetical protein